MAAPRCPLVYYPDSRPGIRRRRQGRGFSYLAPDGTRIDDRDERARLEALAVPPAYEDVWMSPRADAHLQATGRDSRQRKQYRYHPDWTAWRAARKFDNLAAFGAALPRLRRRIARDLAGEAGDREFAVAAVVALLDRTAMRIGHPENAALFGTRGATTLKRSHVELGDEGILLSYRAKGGRQVRRRLKDQTLQRVLHRLDDLPGRDLVAWTDDEGRPHSVSSEAVNEYISETIEEEEATAKTFRTWAGSLAAFEVAIRAEKPTIKAMSEVAAARLANTPAIARSSYIHPAVIGLADREAAERQQIAAADARRSGLRKSEVLLLRLIEEAPGPTRNLAASSRLERSDGTHGDAT